MNQTAAHLVDRVLPDVPIRQWVLTFPFRLRHLLAMNPDLQTGVLRIAVRAITTALRHRARAPRDAQTGAVAVLQRFDSALRLNLHAHNLFLDGAFTRDAPDHPPTFQVAPPPTDADVARLAATIRRRVNRLLERRGFTVDDPDAAQPDPASHDEPLLANLYAAA